MLNSSIYQLRMSGSISKTFLVMLFINKKYCVFQTLIMFFLVFNVKKKCFDQSLEHWPANLKIKKQV